LVDRRTLPGAVNTSPAGAALALGGGIGLLISIILLHKKILPMSFEQGTPELDVDKERRKAEQIERTRAAAARGGNTLEYEPGKIDVSEDVPPEYTRAQIRAELRKEMLFLMPPLVVAAVCVLLAIKVPAIATYWRPLIANHDWVSGGLGALLGGLVGGFLIWFTRIIASICFGREAMGLGDVDLMLGIGAVLGPGGAVIAFFLAPFCGIAVAVYKLILRQGREIPYGPYLSMGAALTMLFYCPIAEHFSPGLAFLAMKMRDVIGM
jgi:leader peptidase (prepilin peptidase) / N-methyltransferase